MDIAFHYFAIKSLAGLAGFDEDEAQIIAAYSQMVDDFDYTRYWHCTNVPNYIINSDQYDLCVFRGLFNPVQTGFLHGGLTDAVDYVYLAMERGQRFTCAPFHFIYQDKEQIDKKEYRVIPASLTDDSIITNLFVQAGNELNDLYANKMIRRKALMKVGMLLHIFADTVAHQMFSGFNADVNVVELMEVTNNITGNDETPKYRSFLAKFSNMLQGVIPRLIPAIGHTMLGHVPDLTHLSFLVRYKDEDGEDQFYTRSNTSAFIAVSKTILNYLCACNRRENVSEDEWREIEKKLRNSFLTDISEYSDEEKIVDHLRGVWNKQFPAYTYQYSSKEIKKSFVLMTQPLDNSVNLEGISEALAPLCSTKASDDFYLFNVNADEVLIALYGPQPRY